MPRGLIRAILLSSSFVLLTACTTSAQVTSVYSDDTYSSSSFKNVLVIGVAGNYDSRALFERTIVADITAEGASASAYYSIRGNTPITSAAVLDVVKRGNFDAVLVTAVVDQNVDVAVKGGSAETKVSLVDTDSFNFFRYDYEELNAPEVINFNMTVVLRTELFSSADKKLIWAIETRSSDVTVVGQLIENIATAVVGRLQKDGYIGR